MIARERSAVTQYETPSDTQVVITRVVDAPRRLVFEAWTNPKYIA